MEDDHFPEPYFQSLIFSFCRIVDGKNNSTKLFINVITINFRNYENIALNSEMI